MVFFFISPQKAERQEKMGIGADADYLNPFKARVGPILVMAEDSAPNESPDLSSFAQMGFLTLFHFSRNIIWC